MFRCIPDHLVTPIISAIAILVSSLLGAYCSWIITKKSTSRNIKEQYKILEQNRRYEESTYCQKVCSYANIIRLDICTVLFQSFRAVKKSNKGEFLYYPIPINKNYSTLVAFFSDKLDLKELSYIYQLYAIIEKLNYDILNLCIDKDENLKQVNRDYEEVLKKVYGENWSSALSIDEDESTYTEMYDNQWTKDGYRKVLKKLDELCVIENKCK